jgi:hypothetical protein
MKIKASMIIVVLSCLYTGGLVFAEDTEIAGVKFSSQKTVAGQTLKLNGVAVRKALMVVKVFAGGFYLEKPTQDAREAIESEQVKHFYLHYLTNKATAKKVREGFIEAMEKANSPELIEKHRQEIDRFASWLDTDMQPGSNTESTYVPGEGLTFWVNGEKRGTIQDIEFIQMYYRYNLGEKADKNLRAGYLGLK